MIAIIDYRAGNLTSVKLAFDALGVESIVTSDPTVIRSCARVVFPGVGAAGSAMRNLADLNLITVLREVIAAGLNFPTGVLTWRDGAIVTAAPDILFISPDGTKKVLYTGFSTGNQQLRVNGLRWGMDGWVYCAAGAHHGGYNKGTMIECKLTGEKIDLEPLDPLLLLL